MNYSAMESYCLEHLSQNLRYDLLAQFLNLVTKFDPLKNLLPDQLCQVGSLDGYCS